MSEDQKLSPETIHILRRLEMINASINLKMMELESLTFYKSQIEALIKKAMSEKNTIKGDDVPHV